MTRGRFVGLKTLLYDISASLRLLVQNVVGQSFPGTLGWFSHLGKVVLCLFVLGASLAASNHPPVTGRNANCALCHADMTQGSSVHSQGELACGLCHSSEADGSTVKMLLTVPKEQLCFACHERSAMQQHVSSGRNTDCLGCHDAHRSARAMLLRRNVETDYAQSRPVPRDPQHPSTTAKLKSHSSTKRHPQN